MAESTIGLFKTEVIRHRGPSRTLDDVEIVTLEYVDWLDNRGVHTELGDVPPTEHEAHHDRRITPTETLETRERR